MDQTIGIDYNPETGYFAPSNPYALVIDGVVTEVIFMKNYSEEDIKKELNKYTFDEYVICKEYGADIHVGQIKYKNRFIEPCPFPSWKFDEDIEWWAPPIDYPQDGKKYVWDEESLSWKNCNCH